jgi:aminoglycoside 3-N-acetyltransferase
MIARILDKVSPTLKPKVRGWVHHIKASWVKRFHAYSAATLIEELRRLGIRSGDTVLVHSAYGPMLGFQGSPSDLIQAFQGAVGPEGHLLMVSLPYLSSTSAYLKSYKPFDVRRTPSRMGLISETFRRMPGVKRSLHPTHSVLAIGPKADWMVAGHEACHYPCGQGSPFEHFLELNGKVLFFGVSEFHFTFHHYLEDIIRHQLPFPLYEEKPYEVAVIDETGQSKQVTTYCFSKEAIQRRRVKVLFDALGRKKQSAKGRVGNTEMTLFSAKDTLDCTLDLAKQGIYFYDLEPKLV